MSVTLLLRYAALLGAVTMLAGCVSSGEDSFGAVERPAPAARATSAAPAAPRTASAQLPSVDPLIDARGECWVKLDRDRRAPKDLDQRVKLVEKCVADKMAAAPGPTAQ